MAELKVWFLDVGHGDCAYLELPNGARMMIDCGCGEDHWPSKLLEHCRITKTENPVSIPNVTERYGLDSLLISHPHADHLMDIAAIDEKIGFYLLSGGYTEFIDKIGDDRVDFRKRGQEAAKYFRNVVKRYKGVYEESKDRVLQSAPTCTVNRARFLPFTDDMDLNELSWFLSIKFAGHKILFTGDMTSTGVNKILQSGRAAEFREFVKGTSILKIPHHGRENGCSQEMFDAFQQKPFLCIASDEVLNEKNEGTSNIPWYSARTSDEKVIVDGVLQNRKVLTTRNDGDIYINLSDQGTLKVTTHALKDVRAKVFENDSLFSSLTAYLNKNAPA